MSFRPLGDHREPLEAEGQSGGNDGEGPRDDDKGEIGGGDLIVSRRDMVISRFYFSVSGFEVYL